MSDARRELRFALAMNGGVSLAVWIGGVCDELLRLCVTGRDMDLADSFDDELSPEWDVYRKVCWTMNRQPRVDVMAGASAGGMNAVFLALGLVHGRQDLHELRDLWVEDGGFSALLRDPVDRAPSSLLRGDDYFLPRLEDAIASLIGEAPISSDEMPIHVVLTATSLEGSRRDYPDDRGKIVREREHAMQLRFRHRSVSDFVVGAPLAGEDAGVTRARLVKRLARACRSTASYPGAFEPSLVTVATGELGTTDPLDCLLRTQASFRGQSYLIDGGTLVNLPVNEAMEAVFLQPAEAAVRRVFAMVVPHPGTGGAGATGVVGDPPTLPKVVGSAVSTIPRNQTVGRSLDELKARNSRLAILRATRLELLKRHWPEVSGIGTCLFDAYVTCRSKTSENGIGKHLEAWLEEQDPPVDAARQSEWRYQISGLEFPWIPRSFQAGTAVDLGRWGRTTVRRSAGRLFHLISLAEDRVPPPGDAEQWRRTVSAAITAMGELSTIGIETNFFREADPAVPVAEVRDEVARLRKRWRAERANVATHLQALGGVVEGLAGERTGFVCVDEVRAGQGTQFLLALEVVENTFRGFRHEVEQSVETIRIDSTTVSPLDGLGRGRADGKVAGVQLAHFGSFLKASWRANDWMWGRLDGAGDLIEVMLKNPPPARMAKLRADLDVGSDAEALRKLKEIRHAEIVIEETGKLVDALRRDRAAGGATQRGALALETAWQRAEPEDPAQRVEHARTLLTLNRVGAETLNDEAGSDLLTRVSITALATGAGLLHQGGPKVLRAPIAGVRYVSLLAWGMLRGAFGGQAGRTFAGVAFGIGAAIVAADVYPGADLGSLLPIGLALLVAGSLIAFARAPFVLVPLLVLVVVPIALTTLPVMMPGWWPPDWPYPSLRHHRDSYLPSVAFLAGGIVIGLIRRPRWMQSLRKDEQRAARRLEVLCGAAEPA